MRYFFTTILILFAIHALSQGVMGRWQTIDDETGKAKSVVEISERNGKLYGKIIQLYREPQEDQNPKCDKCEDDRKDQYIIGMEILRDMQLKEGYYQSGTICDPKNGKIYKCEFWLDGGNPNKLLVRGYWGFFYRTQTWNRAS
ncbi:MAG: DUF2147 domain-containing protein [Flavobacteriales bacterium]|nr:DUF2147 domain-containing protein [Flavobacteriales bacterium]